MSASWLDELRVAKPCSASWADMQGDERVRFCALCQLNVYNLSELTSEEARQLLRRRVPGRICARFYRRFDGTVLTKDCNRGFKWGWHRARALLPGVGGLTFALVVIVAAVLGVAALFGDNYRRLQAASGALAGTDAPPAKAPGNRY